MSFSVTVRTAVAQVQGCFQCLLSKVLCAPHVQWFLSGLHVKKKLSQPEEAGLKLLLGSIYFNSCYKLVGFFVFFLHV